MVTILDFWQRSILKCHQNYIISDNAHYELELFDRIHVLKQIRLAILRLFIGEKPAVFKTRLTGI